MYHIAPPPRRKGEKGANMKRKTYNNVLRGAKLIQAKGYSFDEAAQIAIQIFDNMEQTKNGMSFEWFAQMIADKETYLTMA